MKTPPNPLFSLEQALADVHRLVATISDPDALNKAAAAEILASALFYQKALADMFDLLGVQVDPSPQADRIGVLFHAAGAFGARALNPEGVRKAVARASAKLVEARQLVSDAEATQARNREVIAELTARADADRKTIAGLRVWANRAYEVSQAGGRFAPYTDTGGEFRTIGSTLVTTTPPPEPEPVEPESPDLGLGLDIDLDDIPWAVYQEKQETKPRKTVTVRSQATPRAPALTRPRQAATSIDEINLDDLF